ncbi:hypothetical protein ACNKHR_07370 [Shigella flexneri]
MNTLAGVITLLLVEWALLYFFPKHLALLRRTELNTLTRCVSSLLDLWVSLHFSRTAWRCSGEAPGLPHVAASLRDLLCIPHALHRPGRAGPTDNADERRPFVAGSVVGDG